MSFVLIHCFPLCDVKGGGSGVSKRTKISLEMPPQLQHWIINLFPPWQAADTY